MFLLLHPKKLANQYPTNRLALLSLFLRLVCQDSSLDMYAASGSAPIDFRLEVDGGLIQVYWNEMLAFDQEVSGFVGPGTVGLYSNDNDGGVIYDDFCIYVD